MYKGTVSVGKQNIPSLEGCFDTDLLIHGVISSFDTGFDTN
jgi:hypothetical protein